MNHPSRIGLFGGSFNPIHLGHLIMAEQARNQLRLDQVLIAPAAQPPHKSGQDLAPIADRMSMVQLAISDNDGLTCSDLDIGDAEPSFTWRLLERLRDRYPKADLWFIMGGDSLAEFSTWARPDRILELARIAVVERPGHVFERGGLKSVDLVKAPLCAISSTSIRSMIRDRATVRYLLPDQVRGYIEEHALYRKA